MPSASLESLAFENAPIGLVMTEERIIAACNQTFCKISQFDKNELIGQSFRMFYANDQEFVSKRNIGIKALQLDGSYTDQRLLNCKDGSVKWCRFRAQTLTPDKPLTRIVLSYAVISKPYTHPKLLTSRQRDVVSGLIRGLTSKEIATELGLSVRTIEDVRYRLLKKYDVKTSNELLWQFVNTEI